ncbi:putative Inosine-uridine preferring nucleoside hydrolase [Blattamonas nauphoetae]|uniref:Inosine-uridine preferring nucleoside hydrolase n=1 Tax=Blattamonas nauphoetae TaxID=2049346 RepID=A0ABQ9XSD1_9EUKA|nr:putative Inosine-uridine preferring nucleoside hydrolase [Blattamonas nauphoetae]
MAEQFSPSLLTPSLLRDYVHANRKCYYRTEKPEPSQEEIIRISNTPALPSPIGPYPQYLTPCKVVIDTDIGTDIDDAFALLFALRDPNIEILGVTTNYGVAKIRQQVAQFICNRFAEEHHLESPVRCVTGSSRPLGSHRDYFLTHKEGTPLLDQKYLEENSFLEMQKETHLEAAQFLHEQISSRPHEITIVSIGIPTNIGLLLSEHPEDGDLIKEIVIMGYGSVILNNEELSHRDLKGSHAAETLAIESLSKGNIRLIYPNHNISADTLATKIMFDHPRLRIKILNHTVTAPFIGHGPPIQFLQKEAAKAQLAPEPSHQPEDNPKYPLLPKYHNLSSDGLVGTLMNVWFDIRNRHFQCLYDPLTVYEAAYTDPPGTPPEERTSSVNYICGTMIPHEWAAFGTFVPNPNGNHFFGAEVLAKKTDFTIDTNDTPFMKAFNASFRENEEVLS